MNRSYIKAALAFMLSLTLVYTPIQLLAQNIKTEANTEEVLENTDSEHEEIEQAVVVEEDETSVGSSSETNEETNVEVETEVNELSLSMMNTKAVMNIDMAQGSIKIGTIKKQDGTEVTGYVQSLDLNHLTTENMIPFDGEYIISGDFIQTNIYANTPAIQVFGGTPDKPITLTLDNVKIDTTAVQNSGSGILIGYNINGFDGDVSSYVNINISGVNNIKAGDRSAAIELWYTTDARGNHLTIDTPKVGTAAALGYLEAEGGNNASTIGSGTIISDLNFNNSITINNGEIQVTSSGNGAGIGGAENDMVGLIQINGGKIRAYGDTFGAGIGMGAYTFGSGKPEAFTKIVINGGDIIARGGILAAGIGVGGSVGPARAIKMDIEINGGTIDAVGGSDNAGTISAPAIGVGSGGEPKITVRSIKITGGTVSVYSDLWGAAIGNYFSSLSIIDEIIITGDATVIASNHFGGTAIGRAGQNPASVGMPVNRIQVDQTAKIYVQSAGHYDKDFPTLLPLDWYQAIDVASPFVGDGFVLMGLFNEPFADQKIIEFVNDTEVISMSLLDGHSSFAITLPSADYKIFVDGKRYIATKSISDVTIDQYESMYDNKSAGLNKYWYLQPATVHEIIYHDNLGGTEKTQLQEVVQGRAITIESNMFTTSSNEFLTWNTKRDGTGVDYTESQIIANGLTASIDLYAIWKMAPTPIPTPIVPTTPNPNPGRTCQDDGYPDGYYWSESDQACIIDKVVVKPTARPTVTPTVTPTVSPTTTPVIEEKPNTQEPTAVPTSSPSSGNQGGSDDVTGSWSLITVISALLTLVFSIILILMKKEDDEVEGDKTVSYKRNKLMMWAAIAISVISVIIVLLTQSFSQPMAWFDRYSIIVLILTIVTAILLYFGSVWKEAND